MSKSRIKYYLICFTIMGIYSVIIKPFIEKPYLDNDIRSFENGTWIYTITLCVVLYLMAVIFFLKTKEITDRLYVFLAPFAFFFFSSFFIKGMLDKGMLLFNTTTGNQYVTESYSVVKTKEIECPYLLHNIETLIGNEEELEKIDAIRKRKKQKSLFLLQNQDTVNVIYKTGFFNVKYLE
ncbi:hypothetical protein NAT51_08245 [Flavobacterium amniphilum]|uniref:hypothetical protein n=1 Tax=Flavobacterium amniphilum TaxID=1834035 RepID=UPI00202A6081|nr:hypothetical protein [Flavobacterium amniphilum]MCL9805509.1 hypothetical protein [Flavobacterium amniphilum]